MTAAIATEQAEDLGDRLNRAQASLDAAVAERSTRIAENPELYFAPDQTDRELVGEIHALRREFVRVKALYHSARGEYYFVGCAYGEHKKCRREIKRDGDRLVCGCPCHKGGA